MCCPWAPRPLCGAEPAQGGPQAARPCSWPFQKLPHCKLTMEREGSWNLELGEKTEGWVSGVSERPDFGAHHTSRVHPLVAPESHFIGPICRCVHATGTEPDSRAAPGEGCSAEGSLLQSGAMTQRGDPGGRPCGALPRALRWGGAERPGGEDTCGDV